MKGAAAPQRRQRLRDKEGSGGATMKGVFARQGTGGATTKTEPAARR